MQRRQPKNEHRWVPFQISTFIVLLAGASLDPSVTAQSRHFTAKPLTPDVTISAPRKETVQSSKGALRGRVFTTLVRRAPVRTALNSAVCDVAIAPGSSPAGYMPLSGLGIDPIPGVQDDSVTDFTTPAFTFGGETYTRIGISSNGYAIIGGSTDPDDNTTVNQSFPDPARPNNVLAPFWTDLNPDNGGALRIGVVSDASDSWIVLDWDAVSEFSVVNSNSFEIWIGIKGDAHPVEDISFAYGTIQGSGNGGFLSVGAENKPGTRGQNSYLNGTGTLPAAGADLRVTTTSCVAQKPWSTAGSTGTVSEDSTAIVQLNNFTTGLLPGVTGTVHTRFNITAIKGLTTFCPATQSTVNVRFRNSDNSGIHAQVAFEIHRTSVSAGGDTILFTFNSDGIGAANAFTTASFTPNIDFDFSQYAYWIEATVFRDNAAQFANLGSILIFENAGTPCP